MFLSSVDFFSKPHSIHSFLFFFYINLMYIVFHLCIYFHLHHTLIPLAVMPWELASRRFSKDLPLLLRTLPASFNNSANLLFSSSTSGFAVPSFSSLIPTTNSNIFIASSNLSINKEENSKVWSLTNVQRSSKYVL